MGSRTFLQGASLVLDDNGEVPVYSGEERYGNGSFLRQDSVGPYNPRTVWSAPHIAANVLPHVVGEWVGQGHYCVVTGQPFVTSKIYYTDSTLAKRLAALTYTRDGQQRCTQLTTAVYKADGVTVASQAVDTFTYNGAFPTVVARQVTTF